MEDSLNRKGSLSKHQEKRLSKNLPLEMYKEIKMFKDCGWYCKSLDKNGPSLYNNKEMIRNSLNFVRFNDSLISKDNDLN